MWDGYESELVERSYEDKAELNINVLDNKIVNEETSEHKKQLIIVVQTYLFRLNKEDKPNLPANLQTQFPAQYRLPHHL